MEHVKFEAAAALAQQKKYVNVKLPLSEARCRRRKVLDTYVTGQCLSNGNTRQRWLLLPWKMMLLNGSLSRRDSGKEF